MTMYKVEVRVMPRRSLLDPQGQAVEHALHSLGFNEVSQVRVGKHLVLEVEAGTSDEAVARARTMCSRLLANPVTEDFEIAVRNGKEGGS
jgi:phosphoribosylformylglycinamidine synthase